MKSWIRRSFKNRIFITVLSVTLLPLLLCGVLMMQVQRTRSESSLAQEARLQLSDLERALDDTCRAYSQAADKLCNSTMVRSALRQNNASSRVVYQSLFRETEPLRQYARFDIFNRQGQCIYSTDSPLPASTLDPDWGVLYAAGQSKKLEFRCGTETCALTAARAVRSYDNQILGYVVITMSSSHFGKLFDGLYSATNVVILLDPLWQTLYHTQPAQAKRATASLRAQLLAGEPLTGTDGEYYFFLSHHEETGFSLILQQPKTFSSQVMRTIYTVNSLMGFLCLLLCLL